MCFSMGVTVAMTGLGAAATAVTIRRKEPVAIPATLAYFTLMEALQIAGHASVDSCASPLNQTSTLLSYLHIVFQPFFINAFAMELVPRAVRMRVRVPVFIGCGLSAAVMLLQLWPFPWAGSCQPGTTLCGSVLCTVSGEWHIGWSVPVNDMLAPLAAVPWLSAGFPTYLIAAFLLPLCYGAWRFSVFHALAGPILAWQLTRSPFEAPAIWCLFSIGILMIGLSPWIRARFTAGQDWPWRMAPEG